MSNVAFMVSMIIALFAVSWLIAVLLDRINQFLDRQKAESVTHYTTDGHIVAPYPDMTDDDLRAFESDLSIPSSFDFTIRKEKITMLARFLSLFRRTPTPDKYEVTIESYPIIEAGCEPDFLVGDDYYQEDAGEPIGQIIDIKEHTWMLYLNENLETGRREWGPNKPGRNYNLKIIKAKRFNRFSYLVASPDEERHWYPLGSEDGGL